LAKTEKKNDRSKFKFRMDITTKVLLDVFRSRGWTQVEGESAAWDLFWCDLSQVAPTLDGRRLRGNLHVPHFRNYYEISRKDHLSRNLARHKKFLIKEGRDEEAKLCDCLPITFELPTDFLMFAEHYRKNQGLTWIVKPANGAKGRGIFLFRRLKELKDWVSNKEWSGRGDNSAMAGDGPKKEAQPEIWIVQQYVEAPYLVAGRKFDIRIYVLVVSFQPLKVWVAREGFARFSGSLFDMDQLKNNYVHLTNAAIQLHPENENMGCKWSMRRVREFLTACHGYDKVEELMQNIAKVILISLQSVQRIIMQSPHSFELYGYDIILTEDLKPLLLEVNASPSLESTDADDYKLKFDLLTDVFNIIDFEKQLTGKEMRIGGFDLMWDDGPIYTPCINANSCGPIYKGVNQRLNICLGAVNDRVEQLEAMKLWQKYSITKQTMNC